MKLSPNLASLGDRIEIAGLSGQTYHYAMLPEGVAPPSQGANLIVAELRRREWRVLHVAHTDYLPRRDWRPALDQIRAERPRARLLFRLNISHGVREAEADDIERLHLRPPAQAA